MTRYVGNTVNQHEPVTSLKRNAFCKAVQGHAAQISWSSETLSESVGQRPARLDVWEEQAVRSRPEEAEDVQSHLRAQPRSPTRPRKSSETSGSVDCKTLIIGRKSTVNRWVTYESAVTESYERSVTNNGRRSRHLAVKGSHGPWHSP